MEFSVISYTGLQLPCSSPGQPAVCRDKADKSVGPISQAVQLRPGPRARVKLNAVPERRQEAPTWHLAALPSQLISQQAGPRLHSCTIPELAWIWGANNNHVQKEYFSTECFCLFVFNTVVLTVPRCQAE